MTALSPWIREHGTSVNHLLHHFGNNSAFIMGVTMDAEFWDLACRYKFLVSTTLAVSASHLRHHTVDPAPHRIAELAQESAAIGALRPALDQPLHKERATALLTAAVMLNAVSFALVESLAVSTSWVFNGTDQPLDGLGWLDLQLQFKKLEDATARFRDTPFLQQPAPPGNATLNHGGDNEADPNIVPAAWKMLIGEVGSRTWRLYREPINALASLRLVGPDCLGSLAYIGFPRSLNDGFRGLLEDRDPAAMWIVGYWLGLLGRVRMWWSERRTQRDKAAILCFLCREGLDNRPGLEGQMWRDLIADLETSSLWPLPELMEEVASEDKTKPYAISADTESPKPAPAACTSTNVIEATT